jgi:hypothetical protein
VPVTNSVGLWARLIFLIYYSRGPTDRYYIHRRVREHRSSSLWRRRDQERRAPEQGDEKTEKGEAGKIHAKFICQAEGRVTCTRGPGQLAAV